MAKIFDEDGNLLPEYRFGPKYLFGLQIDPVELNLHSLTKSIKPILPPLPDLDTIEFPEKEEVYNYGYSSPSILSAGMIGDMILFGTEFEPFTDEELKSLRINIAAREMLKATDGDVEAAIAAIKKAANKKAK